jgi:hypothetical protein
VAEGPRDALARGRILGQPVDLPVREHLQPVLDPAQRVVVVVQRLGQRGVEVSGRDRGVERGVERGGPQRGLAAATRQLRELDDELDLADAARAELDVVLELAPRDLGVDHRLHRAQAVDRVEVEVAPVDEGPQRFEQPRAGDAVARDRSRLDPRVALPVATLALVVLLHRREAERDAAGAAEGPQAQVDAVAEAVGGDVAEQLREALAEPGEPVLVVERPRAVARPGLREGEDQVDVGREVELAAAELAHPDHDQPLRRTVGRARRAEARDEAGFEVRERALDAALGELGQRPQRGRHVVEPEHVARDDPDALEPAEAPKGRHRVGVVDRGPRRVEPRARKARVVDQGSERRGGLRPAHQRVDDEVAGGDDRPEAFTQRRIRAGDAGLAAGRGDAVESGRRVWRDRGHRGDSSRTHPRCPRGRAGGPARRWADRPDRRPTVPGARPDRLRARAAGIEGAGKTKPALGSAGSVPPLRPQSHGRSETTRAPAAMHDAVQHAAGAPEAPFRSGSAYPSRFPRHGCGASHVTGAHR